MHFQSNRQDHLAALRKLIVGSHRDATLEDLRVANAKRLSNILRIGSELIDIPHARIQPEMRLRAVNLVLEDLATVLEGYSEVLESFRLP